MNTFNKVKNYSTGIIFIAIIIYSLTQQSFKQLFHDPIAVSLILILINIGLITEIKNITTKYKTQELNNEPITIKNILFNILWLTTPFSFLSIYSFQLYTIIR